MKPLDYTKPIPAEFWNKPKHNGAIVVDKYNGKTLNVYLPYGYSKGTSYPFFYFKMGTNNTAAQFFTYPGDTSHFEYVLDNLIEKGIIVPTIVVSIDGNAPNQGWLQYNAQGLVNYVENKFNRGLRRSIFTRVLSNTRRAVGGWSLGAIECRTMLVDDVHNGYYRLFGYYDIQSGYNANGMNNISQSPFVGCAAGSNDDPNCVKFTKQCAEYFKGTRNVAQVVDGYTHMIKFQNNYFYCAIQAFFGI